MTGPSALLTPEVGVIKDVLYSQLMKIMGFTRPNLLTRSLFFMLNKPISRMARILVDLDHNIARNGWNSAATDFQANFIRDTKVIGYENIPLQGPLMVIGNHPAAYDIAILASAIRRDDLKILASDIELIQLFPNVAAHAIPVPYHIPSRRKTIIASIRQLEEGGSLFLFPRGDVEPDPSVSPGAEQSLLKWSTSIEMFIRLVPQTVTVVAISSGILSSRWYKNPLIQRWKKPEQRQKVAEIFQICTQLLTGKVPNVTPLVTFSPPLTLTDLGGEDSPEGTLHKNLLEQARLLLELHPHVS